MDQLTAIGLIAGLLTTIGFIPQIIKALRSKSMRDYSLVMPLLLGIGMLLWLIYGIYLDSLPIILWNSISFIFNLIIIGLKISYGKN